MYERGKAPEAIVGRVPWFAMHTDDVRLRPEAAIIFCRRSKLDRATSLVADLTGKNDFTRQKERVGLLVIDLTTMSVGAREEGDGAKLVPLLMAHFDRNRVARSP